MDDRTPETWLPVVGWEGHYEVSDLGRVRSLPRVVIRSNGRPYTVRGGIRCPVVPKDGYPRVGLGRSDPVKVHKLVITAFRGQRPPGLECRHLDGNPANSALSNLCWGTHRENQLDQVRHGTNVQAAWTHCKRGHVLAAPNLALWARGRRCYACALATCTGGYARRCGRVIDMQAESDRRYREIMSAAAQADRSGRRRDSRPHAPTQPAPQR